MDSNTTGFHFRRASPDIVLLGLLVAGVGAWLLLRQGPTVTAVFSTVAGLLMILLPLLSSWEVCVDPAEKRLLIRRWWRRTWVDLREIPARELVLMESNTERCLYFPKIVLADGRSWTLPSEIYRDHKQLAQALRSCSPDLVVRDSTLLEEV
ncbi:MAG: hypothetical protein NT154_32595 [Verrucomicrobia bacterium]|nr:hypothetical protein [Verrucomicrobiota bacterium]